MSKEVLAPVVAEVKKLLGAQKFLAESALVDEADHFFTELGLGAGFFEDQAPQQLVRMKRS
jgi:hypothetical protein